MFQNDEENVNKDSKSESTFSDISLKVEIREGLTFVIPIRITPLPCNNICVSNPIPGSSIVSTRQGFEEKILCVSAENYIFQTLKYLPKTVSTASTITMCNSCYDL